MRVVSQFEHDLLQLLQCFLGRGPQSTALAIIQKQQAEPRCLSRDCVELAQDMLTKGIVAMLARQGGWCRQRHLRGEGVKNGRLWERTKPADLGLKFSGETMRFLIWLVGNKPGAEGQSRFPLDRRRQTAGDLLFLFLAYEALNKTDWQAVLQQYAVFARHGLIRLAYPENAAESNYAATNSTEPDFQVWVTGPGSCVLEAWQNKLADRWVNLESSKANYRDAQRMRSLGQRQQQILEHFCTAVREAVRPDLTRFLLIAAGRLLAHNPPVQNWIGGLDVQGLRLADRLECYRAAGAFLRHLDVLAEWVLQAQSVSYFEETYRASQLFKSDWEHANGATLHERARAMLRALEPLQQGTLLQPEHQFPEEPPQTATPGNP